MSMLGMYCLATIAKFREIKCSHLKLFLYLLEIGNMIFQKHKKEIKTKAFALSQKGLDRFCCERFRKSKYKILGNVLIFFI